MTIEELSEKLDKDLDVADQGEPDYLLELSKKVNKWQTLYSRLKSKAHKIQTAMDTKYTELYMFYKQEFTIKLDKSELNTFITSDVEYIKYRDELVQTEIFIQYAEKAVKLLDSQQWALKSRLDYLHVYGFAR